MGINLNMSGSFKPRRKVPQRQLDKLADALGSYADVGVHDDGYVYFNGGDIGSSGSDAITAFIERYAADYVVVTGDCDEGPFEEVICPPHIEQWQAEVRWRQKRIRQLTDEIINIVIEQHKEKS